MADTDVSRLIELADNLLLDKKGERLTDVQKSILQQALLGQKLKEIKVPGYANSTVQQYMAYKLWQLLSELIGKKVGIKNLRIVLEDLAISPSYSYSGSREVPAFSQNSANKPSIPSPQQWELPGGQLDVASPFYIERPLIEVRAYEEIAKPGSLIRIKAPKQMGKTSLLTRLLHRAERHGCRSVNLNFELAESSVFSDLDKFLQWFCATITNSLKQPIEIGKYWSEFLGPKVNCTNYFEEYLLPKIGVPLALGLDAVDLIFPEEKVADDFFGLLRVWYEEARQNYIWKNFRLVIVHGTEVYIPLSNDQSPFNVGLPIVLPEFAASQVKDLARRHGLDWMKEDVEQLMAMVGGHPHLVRLALYKIAREEMSLEQILQDAPTATGIYSNHLRLQLWHLKQFPELVVALKRVVEADSPVELKSALAFKLDSMGLIHLQGNRARIRNDLYHQYFCLQLHDEESQTQPSGFESTINLGKIQKPGLLAGEVKNVLAAILFTDAKDSTQKQHQNQQQTLGAIFRDLDLMSNVCHQFEGQVIKRLGDGLLMCFVSVVKAVKCAQEIQKSLAIAAKDLPIEDVLEHRIGIHLAEVIFNDDDVFGDGVNIANRLQSIAAPGGICISSAVYEAVKTHLELKVTQTGDWEIKGIGFMQLYQVSAQN
ncbi:MAG: AAA-like domain-containing protein [Coleofasciculaceae cyanobacterium]